MAERRMFSKRIVNSARFLKMPISSQALYFHLGLNADDEGVVEAFSVMRMLGAVEDDLRVLAAKGFIRILNDDLVTLITDWNENNLIRKDRFHESKYHELLISMNDPQLLDNQATTIWQPDDNQRLTEVRLGKDRLGEVSIGKDSIGEVKKEKKRFTPPTLEDLEAYIQENMFNVNPQKFIDYYEANGWMIGSHKMKDWKATVRNWDRREQERFQKELNTKKKGGLPF